MKNRILIFLVFLMPSCQSRNEGIKNIVKEWMGKEITIHSEAKFKTLGKDTLCYDLWNKPYKIFTYIDSVGCTGCRLNLQRWESFIDGCRQQQIDIGFIFVVHSSDFSIFDDEIRFKEFDYPVIYDYHNDFEKLNHFPPDPYRTFLLDKDNKVQLIGSPVNNPQMWELYKEIITQSQ